MTPEERDALDLAEAEHRELLRKAALADEMASAGQAVLAGLNARIDAASQAGGPVPVFDGIAALHTALAKYNQAR